MQDQLNQLREEALSALIGVSSLELLDEVRRQYLGKKGALTALLRGMGQVPAEDRPWGNSPMRRGRRWKPHSRAAKTR